MSVDEKFVETVSENKTDEMADVLKEFGIEAHYKPASDNGLDLIEYDVSKLNDLIVGEKYIGRPVLTDVLTEEFEDKYTGETTVNHRLELVLIDDSDMEAYICKVNLKEAKDVWENVHEKSGLYKLAMGLMELRYTGISQYYNALDVVNIKSLQKQVARFETMTIKVTEESFTRDDGSNQSYNSFVIVGGKLSE